MKISVALLLACALISCTKLKSTSDDTKTRVIEHSVNYVSTDLRFAMSFKNGSAIIGPLVVLRDDHSPFPLKFIGHNPQMKCLSVGPEGNTDEFALKRPIVLGDRYKCLKTSFIVETCFENCKSAVLRRETPISNGIGTLTAYMLVNQCRGMTAFSQVGDLRNGIPLDAVVLRGNAGILSTTITPRCDMY